MQPPDTELAEQVVPVDVTGRPRGHRGQAELERSLHLGRGPGARKGEDAALLAPLHDGP